MARIGKISNLIASNFALLLRKKIMHEKPPSRLSSAELQLALEKACEKLVHISETDSPVEPFVDSSIAEMSAAAVAAALGRNPGEAVERTDFGSFFEKLTRDRDWHSAAQERMKQRFAELEKLLAANLEEPAVFRFGTVRVDIFVVGRDSDGNLAGVRTMAVET